MSAVGKSLLQLLLPPLEKEDRSADLARVGLGEPTVIIVIESFLPSSSCEARRAIERRFSGMINGSDLLLIINSVAFAFAFAVAFAIAFSVAFAVAFAVAFVMIVDVDDNGLLFDH
jgi:uncharacterized membrane protein YhaH (DUF805 family)